MSESKTTISDVYESWFLDYASYVILERAVPHINDGLKPVQRRILHALRNMDDGRFHKVANVIGQSMQFHPHGDASIGDALVNLGQKGYLIDTQGNWGDVNTGDSAAAPRYIESRLTKFALEVVFNPQTTQWQMSYDGRKKEPITLPVKFPLLLAQGTEGIAVGLATKIMPHNFQELILASIDILRNKPTDIKPDFPTGGLVDCTHYKGGVRGGKIRVRARIEVQSKKRLLIKSVPYGITTPNLMDSILKANDSGKIKIKKIVDNTAKDVEIQVDLAPGTDAETTMDALYAFTNCEVSISPNACVIVDDKPHFLNVNDILKVCTIQTKELLRQELEIRKSELLEKILYGSLEKIFIENRIYRDIEECTTWEEVLETIDRGLDPFKEQFYREITRDDIIRLTEIKIKRISKYDSLKADELMRNWDKELAEVEKNLRNLTKYTIRYYENLLKKYGNAWPRRAEIAEFDTIKATEVALNNQKLYVNRQEGFIGYGMKKDEFVSECSDIDDIIAFTEDGKYYIKRIDEKVYVGKNIIFLAVYNGEAKGICFNVAYRDGKSGATMVKRFKVESVIRDREYDLTKGAAQSKVLYFSANPQEETEIITVKLSSASRAKKKVFDYDFGDLDIKGKNAGGNILTKYPVRRIDRRKSSEKPKNTENGSLFDN